MDIKRELRGIVALLFGILLSLCSEFIADVLGDLSLVREAVTLLGLICGTAGLLTVFIPVIKGLKKEKK